MSVAAFVGQLFIYRMIKMFRQHIVPFVITTRKMVTVGLSIVYFHHATSVGQILSIVLVLAVTVYEFCDNITKKDEIKRAWRIHKTKETIRTELTRNIRQIRSVFIILLRPNQCIQIYGIKINMHLPGQLLDKSSNTFCLNGWF